MAKPVFEERRKHPRYPAFLNVSFVCADEKQGLEDWRISGRGRNISGRTGDISFQGLLVKAAPFHAEISSLFQRTQAGGSMFVIWLEVDLDGAVIQAEGQVKWFKLWYTGQEPYQLEAGVFIQKMDPNSRKSWDAYFTALNA